MQILTASKRGIPSWVRGVWVLILAVLAFTVSADPSCAKTVKHTPVAQQTFKSPEAAVEMLVSAARANDEDRLIAILGPVGRPLVSSGDPIADRRERERFIRRYEEKNRLVNGSERKVFLEIGAEFWPLPIPIIMRNGVWLFDTGSGKEEILNRRIGRNELNAIQVCLAYVDAQLEYAEIMRVREGRRKYAQKFQSGPDRCDGLYWKTGEGEQQSPLGPYAAAAQDETCRKKEADRPTPYHGYIYKILTGQGKHAPGGRYDYVADGNMIGGFALVAYPAQYGASGITTFIVSDAGIVYEKHLGRHTETTVRKMNRFDPDKTWRKVDAKYLSQPGKGS